MRNPELAIYDHDEDGEVYLDDNNMCMHHSMGRILPVQ
jgi:hypothetical protein